MTIKELYLKGYNRLKNKYGKTTTNLLYLIFEHILERPAVEIFMIFEQKIDGKLLNQFNKAVLLLEADYPLQYIFNKAYCLGLEFYVDESVLIPRPETEQLIELCIEKGNITTTTRIIDIGTGSGCIALNIKKLTQAKVLATDISSMALKTAKLNAKKLNIDVEFLKMDLKEPFTFTEKFDIIISNPPYVRPSEKVSANIFFEPSIALFTPKEDPLFYYKKILNFAQKNLKPEGEIFLELNEFLSDKIADLFNQNGYKSLIYNDLNNKKRFLISKKQY